MLEDHVFIWLFILARGKPLGTNGTTLFIQVCLWNLNLISIPKKVRGVSVKGVIKLHNPGSFQGRVGILKGRERFPGGEIEGRMVENRTQTGGFKMQFCCAQTFPVVFRVVHLLRTCKMENRPDFMRVRKGLTLRAAWTGFMNVCVGQNHSRRCLGVWMEHLLKWFAVKKQCGTCREVPMCGFPVCFTCSTSFTIQRNYWWKKVKFNP